MKRKYFLSMVIWFLAMGANHVFADSPSLKTPLGEEQSPKLKPGVAEGYMSKPYYNSQVLLNPRVTLATDDHGEPLYCEGFNLPIIKQKVGSSLSHIAWGEQSTQRFIIAKINPRVRLEGVKRGDYKTYYNNYCVANGLVPIDKHGNPTTVLDMKKKMDEMIKSNWEFRQSDHGICFLSILRNGSSSMVGIEKVSIADYCGCINKYILADPEGRIKSLNDKISMLRKKYLNAYVEYQKNNFLDCDKSNVCRSTASDAAKLHLEEQRRIGQIQEQIAKESFEHCNDPNNYH